MGKPSVFPTGVTLYDKDACYNGYTLFGCALGMALVDMNGRLVRVWRDLMNTTRPLRNGMLLAARGQVPAAPGRGSHREVLLLDWDGTVQRKFDRNLPIETQDGSYYAACCHHDMELLGQSNVYVGAPGNGRENLMILTHKRIFDQRISEKELLDERIIEVNADGEIIWEWNASEHFDEFGLSDEAKVSMYREPANDGRDIPGDWIHLNAINVIGPNRHYDAGDARFHPDNILCSSRQFNSLFIIEKATGKVVWSIGPDYRENEKSAAIGQSIGQHCAHMIPKGLPGEGDILFFDNGSFGGYSAPTAVSPNGVDSMRRHYSRVIELDPASMKLKWHYDRIMFGPMGRVEMAAHHFFSPYISSVQRLPNGNTLVDQGADGQFIELTPDGNIVWEFINPFKNKRAPKGMEFAVYRAWRVPYDWAPIPKPEEQSVVPPDLSSFRVPGSFQAGDPEAVAVSIS